MNKEKTFVLLANDGKKIECEILFTFKSKETDKNYIIYTDHTADDEGNMNVYASIFNPDSPHTSLTDIKTEREWEIVREQMDKLF